jgi:trehalose-6-phosphate synthase
MESTLFFFLLCSVMVQMDDRDPQEQPSASKSRIIAAMHQLPWYATEIGGEIKFELNRSHLSQFVGLESLKNEYDIVYIGWANGACTPAVKDAFWKVKNSVLVEVPRACSIGHYEGYCKSSTEKLIKFCGHCFTMYSGTLQLMDPLKQSNGCTTRI